MKYFFLFLLFPFLLMAQQTYVPDDNFEQVLIDLKLDTPPLNDSVPTKNIDTVTYLDVSYKEINDLTGLDKFISLTFFSCYSNKLYRLKIDNNTFLKELICGSNFLTELDLSNNKSLTTLECSRNRIENLDLSSCEALEELYCSGYSIKNLNVKNCRSLKILWCSGNKLDSLDISDCISLKSLLCSVNQLSNLNVCSSPNLKQVWCQGNRFKTLDFSCNQELTDLSCGSELLHELNIKGCKRLERLICTESKLTYLDVSFCSNLIEIDCSSNELKYLNVKNGNNINMISENEQYFDARDNSELFCIQVDDSSFSANNQLWLKDSTAHYSNDCGYTGLGDKIVKNSISITPNPALDYIEISVGAHHDVPNQLAIFDILGIEQSTPSVLRTATPQEGNLIIEVSYLSPGVYFVRVGDVVKKFVKM